MTGYKHAFRKAFPYTIPVLTGYLLLGLPLALCMRRKGIPFMGILMSLLVYAGSGQYLAVNFYAGYFFCTSDIHDFNGKYQTHILWDITA